NAYFHTKLILFLEKHSLFSYFCASHIYLGSSILGTEIILKGDRKIDTIPSIEDKALRINRNLDIYGTFAEIGAGQETVRHFFRAGGSSRTIAKAMSAYDKDRSEEHTSELQSRENLVCRLLL